MLSAYKQERVSSDYQDQPASRRNRKGGRFTGTPSLATQSLDSPNPATLKSASDHQPIPTSVHLCIRPSDHTGWGGLTAWGEAYAPERVRGGRYRQGMGDERPESRLTQVEAAASMRAAGAEPLVEYVNSHTPWPSKCLKCGRTVTPRLSKVRSDQSPCRPCATTAAGTTRRRAHEVQACAAMEAARLDPIGPYPGALKPWPSVCRDCGRAVSPRYAQIQQGGSGCGYCAGKRVDPDEAAAAMQRAGVTPTTVYPGSNRPWPCTCTNCGRAVTPMYASVDSGQSACKYCARRAIDPEEAERRMRAVGFEPLEPYTSARKPWRCRCLECGSEVRPRLAYVITGGRGCSTCAGNSAATADEAFREFEVAGYKPKGPFPGGVESHWPSLCTGCGNDVEPTLKAVRKGAKCVYCAQRQVEPEAARDLMLQFDLEPLEPYPGSHTPWRCKCLRCGRAVTPRYHHVRSRGTICRYCGKRGPDMTAESSVYLLEHRTYRALKVGVSRKQSTRLRQHCERGWEVVRTWTVPTGADAYRVEALVLSWVRESLLLPPYLSSNEMPQGGWTETIGVDSINATELVNQVEATILAIRQENTEGVIGT